MGAKDTIVALSSGKSKAAIAVIRISGTASFSVVESCLVSKIPFSEISAKTIGLFTFLDPHTRKFIDQVNAVKYCGPHSFTGEDMVELFCHGGEIVVERILSSLLECGAVYAEKGEFTRRAYLNGKFDLVKAEAIRDIIESTSEREYAGAVEAYFGGSRETIRGWKEAIKSILRNVEAGIEFPEEECIPEESKLVEEKTIGRIIEDIENDIIRREKSRIIEKGINIPIVGAPNAGKSSLFNVLVGSERSIVHWEEGTTRDCISEDVMIGNEEVRFLDTAGLREAKSFVEDRGVQKTMDLINSTLLVVWVTAADVKLSVYERENILRRERTICVISKKDLASTKEKEILLEREGIPYVCACLNGKESKDMVISFIEKQINEKIGSIEMPVFVRNKRQEIVIRNLLEDLKSAKGGRINGEEICAAFLQKALDDIGQFVGETTADDIINEIFSEFCIGK